jgi:glyoxylase-like metal-dependent hydrolase (beta-lactamase superfamily II)
VVDGGELRLELIPTPGHTGDHLAVWIPALRTLLAGDAAERPIPCCGDGSNPRELVQSLRRLQALDAAVVIPCHGGVSDASLLAGNIAYMEAIEARVRQVFTVSADPVAEAEAADDTLIGYPYEDAVRDQGCDPLAVPDFYRQWHRLAIRAVAGAVAAEHS